MGLKVGIDFGTSNSGVAIYQDGEVHVLPIDSKNVVPEVVKTILYITRDYKHFIGQEAVENYYKHNINRQRRFVKKWSGEIDYTGAEYALRARYIRLCGRAAAGKTAAVHQDSIALRKIPGDAGLRAVLQPDRHHLQATCRH